MRYCDEAADATVRAMVQHKTEEHLEEAQLNHQYLQDSS